MTQVISLKPKDTEWLCKHTQSSVYDSMKFYNALVQFSHDYLKSKGIVIETRVANFGMNSFFQNKDFVDASSSYADNMMNSDDSMKMVGARRGR